MTVKIAITGAEGKMGSATKAALAKDDGFLLTFEIDPKFQVQDLEEQIQNRSSEPDAALQVSSLAQLESASKMLGKSPNELCDVLIDFTNADSLFATAKWCATHRVHLVSGSTGLGEDQIAELAALFSDKDSPNCILASNFSISAVILMHLVGIAAPYFDSVEIIELHHDEKKDAPSGTAIATASHIANALEKVNGSGLRKDPTETEKIPHARGATAPGGIRIHSVRLHGLVAHEEVLFGAEGQSLTIRQDSYDRTSFMPGVLLAARQVSGRPGITIGLEKLLNL